MTLHNSYELVSPVDFGAANDDPDPSDEPGFTTTPPTVNAQFYSWDHLGSTRLLTDEAGYEIGHWKYYPFGQEAENNGTSPRHKFTGHERDAEVGLDYMRFRSYGPSLARFLSPDLSRRDTNPVDPQTWNLYTYVRNSPLNLVDPNGKEFTTKEGKDLAEDVQNDSSMTTDQKAAVDSVASSATKVEVSTSDLAVSKISAPGKPVSAGGELAPGEMVALGAPESVKALTDAHSSTSSSSVVYETVINSSKAPVAAILIFVGSHDMQPPEGTTDLQHAVRSTFVHAAGHLDGKSQGAGIRPEADVFLRFMGTSSE